MKEKDMPDGQTFIERMRDAALDEQRRVQTRNGRVADIARGNFRSQVGEVVAIEDGDGATTGAFVVETEDSTGTAWMAVNDGKRLPMGWRTRQMAVLHLLSIRYGDGESMGLAPVYAARVLGIQDTDQEA
jgi:hypothetical protein